MGDVTRAGRTVLFVSHNMAAIRKLCPRAVWLREGQVARVGEPDDVIETYLGSTSNTQTSFQSMPPGDMFCHEYAPEQDGVAAVTAVRLSNKRGEPLSRAFTWQDINFSIEFVVAASLRNFAVELCIATLDGVPLIVTSTEPDHTLSFSVEPGCYRLNLRMDHLALAAGEYVVGLRLAIPWVEYVFRMDNAFRLWVDASDVFGSGFAPTTRRSVMVVPHEWETPVLLSEAASAPEGVAVG
jgi:lipopolysaccharide transport system ATP-binding protein